MKVALSKKSKEITIKDDYVHSYAADLGGTDYPPNKELFVKERTEPP